MLNLNSEIEVKCSRAGCQDTAAFEVIWRNPKIHDETRRKVWLACGEHQQFLVDYLAVRSFFIESLAISQEPGQ
jgi:hypothetical protein